MSSADWNEIKRLAADFQRAQLNSSLQRLSERNCIEIINKLIELKLLEVFYTTDGKEYITPSQLTKEIKDELYVHQGRINLTELCTLLSIDLTLLEKKAHDIASSDHAIQLVLGQLISEDYLNTIAEEINEKLQQKGSITIGEIAKIYDLPGDFLLKAVTKRIGKIIKGQQDEGDAQTFFTESFVAHHKYKIRGVLAAITQPTPVANIISMYQFQERLFFNIAEKLIANGTIAGNLSGGRVLAQALYIPYIYTKAQYDWVQNFLKQNGYLEFEALHRLGISDAAGYIKKHFSDQPLTFVPGACVGQLFIDQIDANLEDALINGQYVDVAPFLPSTFSGDVCKGLIQLALKAREKAAKANGCQTTNCQIFCDTIVVSENLLTTLSIKFEEMMPIKAKEAIAKGAFKHQLSSAKIKTEDESGKNKKDERRKKAAGGKSGGGTQGRETKTKSTKHKHKGKRGGSHFSDEDDEMEGHKSEKVSSAIEFLSYDELVNELANFPEFEDGSEELLEALANHLHEPLTKKFQDVAKDAFMTVMTDGGDTRKKTHQQMQEKVTLLLTTVRLAEKGLRSWMRQGCACPVRWLFGMLIRIAGALVIGPASLVARLAEGILVAALAVACCKEEIEAQLIKYLLRTHCSEVVNELVLYLADESQIDLKGKELSQELRMKIINQFNDDLKQPLISIHKSLNLTTMEDFMSKIDEALAAADILMRKKDNKKDKQSLLSHRSGLVDQLNGSMNAALTLHLCCLILFQAVTGNLLHASGKFVPQILTFLKPQLPRELSELLHEYQGLVMKLLTMKGDCVDEQSSINTRMEELSPKLKEMCITFKKSTRENSLSED